MLLSKLEYLVVVFLLNLVYTAFTCPDDAIKCRDDIQCLQKYQLCDGYQHCNDGSDEDRDFCMVFPHFTKKPKDVTVKAGTIARLECSAIGRPNPTIAWLKDGDDDFAAARERRMHVLHEDNTFFIVQVTNQDEGMYTCTATNEAGSINSNLYLTVLPN